eukprot:Gb_05063 [translate_table: standard]
MRRDNRERTPRCLDGMQEVPRFLGGRGHPEAQEDANVQVQNVGLKRERPGAQLGHERFPALTSSRITISSPSILNGLVLQVSNLQRPRRLCAIPRSTTRLPFARPGAQGFKCLSHKKLVPKKKEEAFL